MNLSRPPSFSGRGSVLWVSVLQSLLIVVALAAMVFGINYFGRELQIKERRAEVSFQLELFHTKLQVEIDTGMQVARSIALFLSQSDALSEEAYARLAASAGVNKEALINIAWAPDLVISHVYPIAGNEALIGLDYRDLPTQIEQVQQVKDTGTPALIGPLSLVQGPKGVILRVPVFETTQGDPQFRGVLSLVYNLDLLLASVGMTDDGLGLEMALLTESGDVSVSLGTADYADWSAQNPVAEPISLLGRSWTLMAQPSGGWAQADMERVIMMAGLSIASLIIAIVSIAAIWLAASLKEAERKKGLSDQRFDSAVRNAPGVFFTYLQSHDGQDRLEFISERCRDIWECEPGDLYKDPSRLWGQDGAEQHLEWNATVSRALIEGERWNFVWSIVTPSGTEKWLEGWGHPNPDQSEGAKWDNFVLDITEDRKKDLELEQKAMQVLAAQKQESIGQLTGGVAHDFNNLLAVIMGNLELLLDDATDDGQKRLITNSLKATQRGADLTRNMLAFARKARLEPKLIELNQLVLDTGSWTRRVLPANIDVVTDLQPDLWAIEADPSSTESALLNLILNARDAMPLGGHLRISSKNMFVVEAQITTSGGDLPPGAYVVLTVEDTGTGIASEAQDMIFEPFYTTKSPGRGSGLGLSMVQGFMQQSGGAVAVVSTIGEGTTFKLFFNAVMKDPKAAQEETGSETEAAFSQARILLAEDEEAVRLVLVQSLEKMGYDVCAANSGDAAYLHFVQDQDFDLVLTDIVMPGKLQGPELCAKIRNDSPDMPVIFMSGYASMTDQALPNDDRTIRLTKPASQAQLKTAIETVLLRRDA
ncbi:Blue-light-activated protein [Pelagimonas phthalicica]|uniref:histidine kinase n=1 Tax=Pelagimonas phthalicica TaxID=1037362 RepID=A0A238JIN4_9RHOB|nr:response regulator [Pelagimonas phthalicica]TDS90075.1 signal transduction histidine kinase [Pelagimonas phthalicica]SMX30243.1 Blue-light-activated protein [Pelagimonas phthalicica]